MPTQVPVGDPYWDNEWGLVLGGHSDAALAAMIRDEPTDLYDNIDKFDWIYYLNKNPWLGNPSADQIQWGTIDTEAEAYRHYVSVGAFSGLSGFYGDPGWVDPDNPNIDPLLIPAQEETAEVGVIGIPSGPGGVPIEELPGNEAFAGPFPDYYPDGTSTHPPEDEGVLWGNPLYSYNVLPVFREEPVNPWDLNTLPSDNGRAPPPHSDKFDWIYYLNKYPDLRREGLDTESEAWKHWWLHGSPEEGRVAWYEGPETPDVLDQYGYVTVNGERLEDEYGFVTSSEMYYEPGVYPGSAQELSGGFVGDTTYGRGRWRNRVLGYANFTPTPTAEDLALYEEEALIFENLELDIADLWLGDDSASAADLEYLFSVKPEWERVPEVLAAMDVNPMPFWGTGSLGGADFKQFFLANPDDPTYGPMLDWVAQMHLDTDYYGNPIWASEDGSELGGGNIFEGVNLGGLGSLASGGIVGQNSQSFAPVGIASGYGGGGYVGGYSGGMDDSIPAVTDGNSPAALSSGEFVVPADVVAHLGDGNTQNGSAKLMDMLGRIRQQKTGNPVQPDAIQDQWVMPA